MADEKPVYVISDQPERDEVAFGFDADARTLAELISYGKNETPLIIGIFGSWGSGKTTLMETTRRFLSDDSEPYQLGSRPYKTIWYQAWTYRKNDQILADLFETVLRTMEADGFLLWCQAAMTEGVQRFQFLKSTKYLGRLLDGTVDITEVFDRVPHHDRLGFDESFMVNFEQLIWEYINWQPQFPMSEGAEDRTGAMVVFIDELDRCPEEQLVRVLETIKLFMDRQGWIFVIGAQFDLVKNALKTRYTEKAALRFMEKMIHVSYHLPQISDHDFLGFLADLSPEFHKSATDVMGAVMSAMGNNPRRLKRFLNNLSLREGILRNRRLDVSPRHLLCWYSIEFAFPRLFQELRENPSALPLLKKKIELLEAAMGPEGSWEPTDELLEQAAVPESLRAYLRDAALVSILKEFDAPEATLQQLMISYGAAHERVSGERRTPVIDFTAMAEIAPGPFLFGDDQETHVIETPYAIDIYPVTNSRYRPFVESDGYLREEFWSQEGWQWRESHAIDSPSQWKYPAWTADDRPVIGVSRYEVEAFCKWLTAEAEEGITYRLPTEEEWERAGRGTDGREYPWGNTFDEKCCNTAESGLERTTSVTKFSKGVSPEGCHDMAGNVFEWTASVYDPDGSGIVLRGGSWFVNKKVARCAFRYDRPPHTRLNYLGFRCVRVAE
ncbi:hypothetical protein D3OALGA1CA_2621 [Olavius algarvensis associated proteobacterium Delta 3]|nr:hypothetical protein D3OALGA1CA_2621 [Olavius algarvensis associated proteobacterium Delta 3]CAB5145389.1 hypothetical protein D3OALGB2SA_4472 [Olavius algarvensis associated proteobacterium Delta 3]